MPIPTNRLPYVFFKEGEELPEYEYIKRYTPAIYKDSKGVEYDVNIYDINYGENNNDGTTKEVIIATDNKKIPYNWNNYGLHSYIDTYDEFIREYLKYPVSSFAFTDPKQLSIRGFYDGIFGRIISGGRRRKTKKTKRSKRKTQRRR